MVEERQFLIKVCIYKVSQFLISRKFNTKGRKLKKSISARA